MSLRSRHPKARVIDNPGAIKPASIMEVFVNTVLERAKGPSPDLHTAVHLIEEHDSLLALEFLDSAFQQLGPTEVPRPLIHALDARRSTLLLEFYRRSVEYLSSFEPLEQLLRNGFPGLTMADRYQLKEAIRRQTARIKAGLAMGPKGGSGSHLIPGPPSTSRN